MNTLDWIAHLDVELDAIALIQAVAVAGRVAEQDAISQAEQDILDRYKDRLAVLTLAVAQFMVDVNANAELTGDELIANHSELLAKLQTCWASRVTYREEAMGAFEAEVEEM